MSFFRRRVIPISIAAAVSLLAVSCGESKVSQCNKVIEVANKAVQEVQAVTSTANTQDVNSMTKIADTADQAKTSMETLKLADEPLKGFQQRFITMYTDTSKATRDLVKAVNDKNSQAAEQAVKALQTATAPENTLVQEVNTYCTGNAQPSS